MNRSAHKTEGVNRTKTVRVYPFVFTGEVPRKGWRIPLNEIKYNEERDEEASYGYCNDYQPHAVKRMFDYKNEMLYDMQWDGAGNLNQISYVDRFGLFNSTRHLAWTEDNRLYTVADERYYSYYAYDHTGQRTLKMTGDASTVDVNAWEQHTYGCLDHVTLYPSPYMVLTEQGYTNVTEVESRASSLALPRCSNVTERKHYYAGTERVAARIGSGGLSYDATCVTGNGEVAKRSDELFWSGVKLLNGRGNKPEDFKEMSLVDAKGKEVDWLKKIDLDKLAMSWQLEAKLDPGKIHSVIDDNSYPATPGNTRYENEPDVYFYHSDHLGGASWITDVNGKPVQHLQYLPFGEPYVNQHSAGYQERYTFTGKERDEETGYGYFGARYMDHELMTMWLSVDPMADKYPSISPYAYCAWNPVKLVDPDGKDIYRLDVSSGSLKLYQKTKDKHDRIVAGSYQGIGRAKTFKKTGKSILFSKGVLDGVKGKEYSKTGFTSSNGTQGQATSVAKFISFNCHRELSGAGFTTKNGSKELDVFAWSNNTYKSSDNPYNYSAPNNGQIEFHFHIHCGKSDGTMGNGTPSGSDLKFARTQASTYGEDNFYIISRHEGVTQYNQFGVIFSTVKDYHIPPALKRHQKK